MSFSLIYTMVTFPVLIIVKDMIWVQFHVYTHIISSSFYDYWTNVNFYILIYFLPCHIPEMLLNMIVINLIWIGAIIPNV